MKIGLVLSGGGGKGAYELGVWKALKYMGINKYIDVFSGASVGAFNAVLFAQDDMDVAEALWNEVTMEKLAPISKFKLLKNGVGLAIGGKSLSFAKKYVNQKAEVGAASKDGAKEIIDKYLNMNTLKRRGKICYASCTELPNFNTKYFKINDYDDDLGKEIVIASASLPLIYDCTEILGEKYIDGGVSDNTPIQPVYEEGCDIIIVVLLSREARINRELYPNAKIIEIIPRNLEENILTGTLNLDYESKQKRIKEGYQDTIAMLEPIIAMANLKSEIEEKQEFPILFKLYNFFKRVLTKRKQKEKLYNEKIHENM